MAELKNYQQIVESVGAEYLETRDGVVYFRCESGAVLSLYAFALTPENVALAVKDVREKVLDFPPLLAEQ